MSVLLGTNSTSAVSPSRSSEQGGEGQSAGADRPKPRSAGESDAYCGRPRCMEVWGSLRWTHLTKAALQQRRCFQAEALHCNTWKATKGKHVAYSFQCWADTLDWSG
jgi:hypothetical protein